MLIPIFVSAPNSLNDVQSQSQVIILGELGQQGLEARTLGKTDYPTSFPLREVLTLAKHCSGGVILGFSQLRIIQGMLKEGTQNQTRINRRQLMQMPTPWNQLEAGILFALNIPLLVFREDGITGGVFDNGVTDLFIHPMPKPSIDYDERKALKQVFQKWTGLVQAHYYG